FSSARLFALRNFGSAALFSSTLDRIEQAFQRQLAVHRLRPRILHGYASASWAVAQRYCRCNLIDVLATRARRSSKRLLEVSLANAKLSHSGVQRIHGWTIAARDFTEKAHSSPAGLAQRARNVTISMVMSNYHIAVVGTSCRAGPELLAGLERRYVRAGWLTG